MAHVSGCVSGRVTVAQRSMIGLVLDLLRMNCSMDLRRVIEQ